MIKNASHEKRLLVFVDESNVTGAARYQNKKLDWIRLKNALLKTLGNVELVEIVVYVGLPPATEELKRKRERKERFVYWMRSNGFLVVTKDGTPKDDTSYRANVDVMMAIDAVELSLDIQPDIVVLVTGDSDFSHLALKLRRRGIAVKVLATEETLGGSLKLAVNGIIRLEAILAEMDDFYAAPGEDD